MTDDDEIAAPSKTRRKQDMAALQALGEELVALAADQVKRLDIPENLLEAVRTAQQMTRPDESRRRQMQFIGKLMRTVDVLPIRAALDQVRGNSAAATATLHRLEQLRSDLLADEKALQAIVERYPSVDLQHLRSLRRAALKEQHEKKPPRSYRAIFQLFKELETGEADEEPGQVQAE